LALVLVGEGCCKLRFLGGATLLLGRGGVLMVGFHFLCVLREMDVDVFLVLAFSFV
jgi:hypothetical protein